MTPAGDGASLPQSSAARWSRFALAALAGALTVFGFAPFGIAGLPILSLALLFGLWQRAARAGEAAWLGFAFGAGLFGAGVSWIYVALEKFGGMPAPLAFLATAGFVAVLSLYPALAGWVSVRWTAARRFPRLFAAASAFVLVEWLRGYLFTGFPWLTAGYSQLPDSPLVGFAPVGGVWLVSLAMTHLAALLVHAVDAVETGRWRVTLGCAIAAVAVAATGLALRGIEWTTANGAPLPVSLVQGNVAQDLKFDAAFREQTFAIYQTLTAKSRGRLIVFPESTFPMFADEVPADVVTTLADIARARDGELLFGLFAVLPPEQAGDEPRIYNSVVSVGTRPTQLYRKRHLVPFGETIPAKPLVGWVMRNLLSIPIGDQARGPDDQLPFLVGDETIAVNICYEDAFGDELRGEARDATLLVNVTNDAWYGRSIAARQHNQIAAMRAVELGRPMLRSTNTGITSAIGHDGRVLAELPWFTQGVLEVAIAGRRGETPYLRFGDGLPLVAAIVLLIASIAIGRGYPRRTRGLKRVRGP